jgi:amino acid transporter
MVGKFATALELFILLPVLVLVVIALTKWHHSPFAPIVPPHQPPFRVFGVGLAIGLWLYSGYEQCSTVAEEVENPRRTYPIALALVVPMSIAAYFLPALASLAALGNWSDWHTGYFSTAAQLIGGPWLGAWLTIAAMITYVSLLNATILASTRMPFAMAEDGYLPRVLTGKHPRYGTPWIAIVTSSAVYALLAIHSLLQLIAIYNWLRVATTVMTVLAAWQLRRRKPDMPRPFLIPGGRTGLFYCVVAVIIMSAVALLGSDRYGLIWGPVALAVGPVVYFALRRSAIRSTEPPHAI